jgi:hypothetical protein
MSKPSSRILQASLTEAKSSRRRISPSEKLRCGMPRSAAFSLIFCASSGSGCGVRSPFSQRNQPGPGLLAQPSHLDDHVGDRHLAVVRVLGGAALAAAIADVETRQISRRKGADRTMTLSTCSGSAPSSSNEVHPGRKQSAAFAGASLHFDGETSSFASRPR